MLWGILRILVVISKASLARLVFCGSGIVTVVSAQHQRNLLPNPPAMSWSERFSRSCSGVMCPMTDIWASVACMGLFFVTMESLLPSQASFRTSLRVLPCRSCCFRTRVNSVSMNSFRLSAAPGSMVLPAGVTCGSRTVWMTPSPVERPFLTHSVNHS